MITSLKRRESKKPTRVILFDIDGTLIKDGPKPYQWSGQGVAQWQNFCKEIWTLDESHGTHTLFGIATFKLEFQNPGGRGDAVSDMVLGECGQPKEHSLFEFIDPSLIFFTNHSCKIQNALKLVSNTHGHLSEDDVWIMDDSLELVIKPAQKAGYRAYHAKGFNHNAEAVSTLMAGILEDIAEHSQRFSAPKLPTTIEDVVLCLKHECLLNVQEEEEKEEEYLPPQKPLIFYLRDLIQTPQTNALEILSEEFKKVSPRKK